MLIRESAHRLAGHRRIEQRLFACTGAWVADESDPAARRLLAAESHHHAWRASMWDGLVPVLHDVAPAELEPDPALVEVLDTLAETSGTVERLAGLAQVVLPFVSHRYEEHRAAASEVADAPVLRVLRLVSADASDDGEAAESLLRDVLRTDDDRARAGAARSVLDVRLSAIGS